MGAWGDDPWDNDLAADWFHDFFRGVKANVRIRKAFKDPNDLPVIRGACFLLGALGRPCRRPGTGRLQRLVVRPGHAADSRPEQHIA